jgi:hypothetical protein
MSEARKINIQVDIDDTGNASIQDISVNGENKRLDQIVALNENTDVSGTSHQLKKLIYGEQNLNQASEPEKQFVSSEPEKQFVSSEENQNKPSVMGTKLTGKYEKYTLGSLLIALNKNQRNKVDEKNKLIKHITDNLDKFKGMTPEQINSSIIQFNEKNKLKIGISKNGYIIQGGAHKSLKNSRHPDKRISTKVHANKPNITRRIIARHRTTRRH